MENAIKLFLEVKELIYEGRSREAKILVEEAVIDINDEAEAIFSWYLKGLVDGIGHKELVFFMEDKDSRYYELIKLSDSKALMVLKCELARAIYSLDMVPSKTNHSLDSRAREAYLVSQQIDDTSSAIYLMSSASTLRLFNRDVRLHVALTLGIYRYCVRNRNDIAENLISGLLIELTTTTMMILSGYEKKDRLFTDILERAIIEVTRDLGLKDTLYFFAQRMLSPMPYIVKIRCVLTFFSYLKSSYSGFLFGETFIRTFLEIVNLFIKDSDKKWFFRELCNVLEGQEFLLPYIAYVSYMEENCFVDECVSTLNAMLSKSYPESVKIYLRAMLGDLSSDSELIGGACRDALDLYIRTDSKIAKYTLMEYSDYVI